MSNKLTSIPDVREDMRTLTECVRALKQTVEVLAGQAGADDDAAVTVGELNAELEQFYKEVTSGKVDFTDLLYDPVLDGILDRAKKTSERLVSEAQRDAAVARAELQTALDNFRRGYEDDNAVIKGKLDELSVVMEDSEAKINQELLVRASETAALAGRIESVVAQTEGNLAAIVDSAITQTDLDSAIATQLNVITTASTNKKIYVQTTAPTSVTTGVYWVDLSGSVPVVKQWSGSVWNTLSATIASVAPSSPSTGALWFDTNVGLLKRWSGSTWATQFAYIQSRTPTTLAVGDLWLDTALNLFKEWNGSAWVAKSNIDLGIMMSSLVTESISKTDSDKTLATRIEKLISIAPDGNNAYINNTQLTTASGSQAIADKVTSLQAQTTGGTAGGFYRLIATSSPSDGAAAEFQVQVRASETGSYGTAALSLQAFSSGVNKVKITTDNFVVGNASGSYVPFVVTSGKLVSQAFVDRAKVENLKAFADLDKLTEANMAVYMDYGAIGNAFIGTAAIKTANIDTAAVTTAKIDNLAVTTAKIADGQITSAKIENLAVESAKIANLTVGNEKISGNAVSSTATNATTFAGGNGNYDAVGYITVRQSNAFGVSRVWAVAYCSNVVVPESFTYATAKLQIWNYSNSSLLAEMTLTPIYKTNVDYYTYGGDASITGVNLVERIVAWTPGVLNVVISNFPIGTAAVLGRLVVTDAASHSTTKTVGIVLQEFSK